MNARRMLIGTIVLGSALLVPVAQAQSPDDRAGLRGPGGIAATQAATTSTHPDNRAVRGPGAVASSGSQTAIRPDDRADRVGPPVGSDVYRSADLSAGSHPDNRADARGPGAVEAVVVQQASASGFDWGDAMIGSLGGVGAALLFTGCFFLLTGQRNKTRLA